MFGFTNTPCLFGTHFLKGCRRRQLDPNFYMLMSPRLLTFCFFDDSEEARESPNIADDDRADDVGVCVCVSQKRAHS